MATMQSRLADLITALGVDFKRRTVPIVFSAQGTLTAHTGLSFVPMLGSGNIVAVKGYANDTGGSSGWSVDVNKNGTTIYGTQGNRPTFSSVDSVAQVGAHSVLTYANGDILSVDIDSIASPAPPSDLVIVVYVLRTGD